MESSTPLTGSALLGMTTTGHGHRSSSSSPQLPSFSCARGTFQRPALSREAKATEHQHQVISQRLRMQQHLATRKEVRRGIGNLVVTAFVVVAIAMAGYTLHREAQLQQQEVH